MDPKRLCPTCHTGELTEGSTVETEVVGPRTYTATVPALCCSNCDEAIVTAATLRAFEGAVARAVASSGAGDEAAVRVMRKAAGLTRVELASLLAVTSETVLAWESGADSPDRATVALLGALAVEALDGLTTTRDRLRELVIAAATPAPDAPVTVKVLLSAA